MNEICQVEDSKTIEWIGENIKDEEIGMVDEILRCYSTLTVLEMSCEFEEEGDKIKK